jgi:predicted metal-dependent peptidase
MEPHVKALNKAMIALMANPALSFFATVTLCLRHEWDDSISTACTNGKRIRYSPTFFLSLSLAVQLFVVVHETLHIAFGHMLRRGSRDPKIWNHACDYVINLIIQDAGFEVWEHCLCDDRFRNMDVVQVYDLLLSGAIKVPANAISFDDLEDPEEGDIPEIEEEIARAILQGNIMAKSAGAKIPAALAFMIESAIAPKLPWYRILHRHMTALAKSGYNYTRPNRRYAPDAFLPSNYSPGLCDISVFLDVSGSMTDEQCSNCLTEAWAILKKLRPKKITFGLFDDTVRSTHIVRSIPDTKKIQFTGRGGTQIKPVMEWAKEHRPNALVVFTDGDFWDRPFNPGVPVIWVIYDNPDFTAPFGKVIRYTTH